MNPEINRERDELEDDELDNILTLTDENGREVPFEFLDLIELDGKGYVVLLPVEEDEGADEDIGEVVILMVESDPDSDEEAYVGVEDEDTLNAVFGIFREKFKNEFGFLDEV